MKLKNVSFLEKHAEKLVIVLTIAVLLTSVYLYGLQSPNRVEISGEVVSPTEIDPLIADEARMLKRRLDSENIPQELAAFNRPRYTDDFVARINRELLPPASFEIAFGGTLPAIEGPDSLDSGKPYYEPVVPAPTIVAARADMGTIVPEEVASIPALTARFPEGTPADTVWASVAGQFDLAEMLDELQKEPSEDMRRIPQDWWAGTFAVVDVQLQRQEQRPDGSWPEEGDPDYSQLTQLVEPMPGQINLREIPDKVTQEQAALLVMQLRQYQLQLIQPPFYQLLGRPWMPPEPEDINTGEEAERVVELRQKIKRNERLIEGWTRQIDLLQNRGQSRPSTPSAPAFSGGSFEDFGEFGPPTSAPTRSRPSANRTNVTQRRIQRFNERIKQKQEENQRYQEEFEMLTGGKVAASRPTTIVPPGGMSPYGEGSFDPAMMEGMPGGAYGPYGPYGPEGAIPPPPGSRPNPAATNVRPSERVTNAEFWARTRGERPGSTDAADAEAVQIRNLGPLVLDPANDNKVDIWANDLSAEPGRVYRYRLRVGVVNPLFNKANLPEAQREEHQQRFLAFSDYSDWSEPVTIERKQHFFVLGGGRAPKPGSVTFSVWKFQNGQWWNEEFRAQPGDPVGGPKTVRLATGESVEVDFSTGAYLVDMDFEYPVPAKIGNIAQKTLQVLLLQDDQLITRRRDVDLRDPKRDWLETQRDVLAAAGLR